MVETIKATIKTLVRSPATIIWCMAFPIILATIFVFMFSSLVSDGTIRTIDIAVVSDGAWEDSGFSQVVDTLSEKGDNQLLSVTEVDSVEEGEDLVASGEVSGVYSVDADGMPELALPPDDASTSDEWAQITSTLLTSVADSYVQESALIERIAQDDPAALSDPTLVEDALGIQPQIEQISITPSTPDMTVRYYYALLGMAAMFCIESAMIAVTQALPNEGALGARRSVSGTSRSTQLVGIMLGSWIVSFAGVAIAFLYIRIVVGIDFSGREGLCLVGLVAATLLATCLGTLFGAVPLKGGARIKGGLTTAIVCGLSALAGLYGTPCMELSDQIAKAAPWSVWVNPVRLTSDLFYCLYYYDSLVPFAARIGACVVFSAICLAAATPIFRRQSYEHL